jgi:hypothetical protein
MQYARTKLLFQNNHSYSLSFTSKRQELKIKVWMFLFDDQTRSEDTSKRVWLFLKIIIRTDHEVYNHTTDSNVKPNGIWETG